MHINMIVTQTYLIYEKDFTHAYTHTLYVYIYYAQTRQSKTYTYHIYVYLICTNKAG